MEASGNDNSSLPKDKTFVIKNEEKVKEGENLNIENIKTLLEKCEKSICEIQKDNGYGSGFLCIIKYPDRFNKICCLITNYHVIDDDMLNYKENIEIIINKQLKKINLNYKRKIWRDEEIDFTCIEILEEDKIIENIKPFDINDNCYNKNFNHQKYDKKGIIVASIEQYKIIEIPQGILYYIENENKNQYFYHDCNTKDGFSGGPVLLINNLSIIGIHKGYEKSAKKKYRNIFKRNN